jgi:hypothetical protein
MLELTTTSEVDPGSKGSQKREVDWDLILPPLALDMREFAFEPLGRPVLVEEGPECRPSNAHFDAATTKAKGPISLSNGGRSVEIA